MDVQIRKAEITDVPAIVDLLRSLGLFAHISAETPQATQERVRKDLAVCTSGNAHLVLVARALRGELLGYGAVHWLPNLILDAPEGYVSELFIKEKFRGQGIGRRVLETIKAEALNRGCSRLMLLNLRSRESYERQFYAKQGWEERPDAANFILQLIRRA